MEQTRQLVETITRGIQEKKGQDIIVCDLQNIDGAIANYFIICQGNSPAQVEAITDRWATLHARSWVKSLRPLRAWTTPNG